MASLYPNLSRMAEVRRRLICSILKALLLIGLGALLIRPDGLMWVAGAGIAGLALTMLPARAPARAAALLPAPHAHNDLMITWAERPALPAHDLFLSYHAPDRAAATLIAERLRRAGLRVWFDQDEILAGQPWMSRVEQGLRQSRAVAVIVGPAGLGLWQQQEAGVAIRLAIRAGGARPVIPVLLPGADREGLPLLLDSFSWVEFRQSLDDDSAFARLLAGAQADADAAIAASMGWQVSTHEVSSTAKC